MDALRHQVTVHIGHASIRTQRVVLDVVDESLRLIGIGIVGVVELAGRGRRWDVLGPWQERVAFIVLLSLFERLKVGGFEIPCVPIFGDYTAVGCLGRGCRNTPAK